MPSQDRSLTWQRGGAVEDDKVTDDEEVASVKGVPPGCTREANLNTGPSPKRRRHVGAQRKTTENATFQRGFGTPVYLKP